jgi:hypothetical protein
MIEGIRPLAFRGQDIILFQLLDPAEINPGFKEAVLLEDIESGKTVEVSGRFIKEQYPERIAQHIKSISDAAISIGADHVMVNTSEPLDQCLRNYLMFRQRRR